MNNKHPLHSKALGLAKTYLFTEKELIKVLQEIDKDKLYRQLDYRSLYDYCLHHLKLSNHQSNSFVCTSRMCTKVPELEKVVSSGKLTVSQASRILKVVEKEPAAWIEKALTLKQRELDREVVQHNPELAIQERIKPVTPTKSELRCGVSHALEERIERVKQVLAAKRQAPVSIEEALEAMAECFLEKHDPVEKAKRHQERVEKKAGQGVPTDLPLSREVKSNPRNIPAAIKHAVTLRDRGQCRHLLPGGSRCDSKSFVDIHHIRPVSFGGLSTLENLITLCSAHHLGVHEKMLG